jgi:hypothetical protein
MDRWAYEALLSALGDRPAANVERSEAKTRFVRRR